MIQEVFEKEIVEARKKAENFLIFNLKINYFDTQDILQNASIKAFKKLNSFKNKCSFHTWYISIVKNEALNFFVKRKKTKEVEDVKDLLKNYSFSWVEPEIYYFDKIQETKKLINKAINDLSEKHKDILNLMLKNSFSHKEVSSKLNIPINSVKTRFFYAKKTLKKILSSYAFNSRS